MPWGLQRFQQTGHSHFVTFSCYHRQQLFTTDSAKRIFERALERVRRSFGLQVYAYVVMPEHIHLLVSEPERGLLADALKSLKQGVSRRLVGGAPFKAGAPFKPSFGLSGNSSGDFSPAFLAKTLLRFQRPQLSPVCRETPLHPSKSGQARVMRTSGRLGMEQLSSVRDRLRRTSGD